MSQRRLSQMVNMVLWKEKNSDEEITHTIQVFPNHKFIEVLSKIILDIQIYFEDGEPQTRSTTLTVTEFLKFSLHRRLLQIPISGRSCDDRIQISRLRVNY